MNKNSFYHIFENPRNPAPCSLPHGLTAHLLRARPNFVLDICRTNTINVLPRDSNRAGIFNFFRTEDGRCRLIAACVTEGVGTVSVHKSLRTGGSLAKHRNVLKRSERIKILEDGGNWREGQNSVLGLRKVKSIKVAAKKKAAKKEAAAEGAAAPAAGAAKAAAPAGGAKPAAAARSPRQPRRNPQPRSSAFFAKQSPRNGPKGPFFVKRHSCRDWFRTTSHDAQASSNGCSSFSSS